MIRRQSIVKLIKLETCNLKSDQQSLVDFALTKICLLTEQQIDPPGKKLHKQTLMIFFIVVRLKISLLMSDTFISCRSLHFEGVAIKVSSVLRDCFSNCRNDFSVNVGRPQSESSFFRL